jgi:Zn-dependent protease with chaperone function
MAKLGCVVLIVATSLACVCGTYASGFVNGLDSGTLAVQVQTLPPPGAPSEMRAPRPVNSGEVKTEQYTLSDERYQKAVAYSRAGYKLYFISYFVGAVVLMVILFSGMAAKFRDFAEGISDKRWIQWLIFVPILTLTTDIFDLPVRMYWHEVSLRYQQSVQRWGSWIADWCKEEAVGVIFALILVGILYLTMQGSPRRWWVYTWLMCLPVLLVTIFISPLVIDPLFNKFTPLKDSNPELVNSIGQLTKHAGVPIPAERMFLMHASEKTNTLNAYVTGLGATKRVVVWDNTIQKTATDETLFIVGHELGHYVLGHVWKGFLYFAVGLFAALYLLYRGLHWALDRWAGDWKIYGQEDWASLAVVLLVLQVLMFVSSPVINFFSRQTEHAADVYGLEVIHGIVSNSDEVAAHAFQVMGEIDLADPNPSPFITIWLYSHPPLADRLVFAHSYDPWDKGQSPKYVK